jgi:hypothetical protein
MDTKKIERIDETKTWFFEKIASLTKPCKTNEKKWGEDPN